MCRVQNNEFSKQIQISALYSVHHIRSHSVNKLHVGVYLFFILLILKKEKTIMKKFSYNVQYVELLFMQFYMSY